MRRATANISRRVGSPTLPAMTADHTCLYFFDIPESRFVTTKADVRSRNSGLSDS